jgi:hypothetical protein
VDRYCWVCPSGADIADLYLFLSEPCKVTQIGITVEHGVDLNFSPQFIDVFVGPYLDKLGLVMQGITIPRCTSGTQLFFTVSSASSFWNTSEGSGGIYDFDMGSDHKGDPTNKEKAHGTSGAGVGGGFVQVSFWGGIPPAPVSHSSNPSIIFETHLTLGKLEIYGTTASLQYCNMNNKGFVSTKNALVNQEISQKVLTAMKHISQLNFNDDLKEESLFQENSSSASSIEATENQEKLSEKAKAAPQYIELVKSKVTPSGKFPDNLDNEVIQKLMHNIKFLDALELEYFRLSNGISAQLRDSILLEKLPFKIDIQQLNPDRFVFVRDEKTEIAIRKSPKFKASKCSNPQCGAGLGLFWSKQCCYCYQKFCNNCMAVQPQKIIEFRWDKPQVVCKMCSSTLNSQEALLRKCQKLGSKFMCKKTDL